MFGIKIEDLKVKYGMINFGEERDGAKNSFHYIANDIVDLKSNYFRLGFHLNEFNDNGYFRDFGYSSLKEFLVNNTDLEYTMAKRCMLVHKKFCQLNGSSRTMYIEDKYKDYNFSQLSELSSMSENDIKDVRADMTVKEIRAIKNRNKIKDDKCDVAPKQTELKNIECVLLNDLDDNKLDYFMVDLLEIINKECNRVLTQTSTKGKQLHFSYGSKKYRLTLNEIKDK